MLVKGAVATAGAAGKVPCNAEGPLPEALFALSAVAVSLAAAFGSAYTGCPAMLLLPGCCLLWVESLTLIVGVLSLLAPAALLQATAISQSAVKPLAVGLS